jgi:hypothetical protein
VLDDLTEAYSMIRRASGGSFNPKEVAKAELAWWIARRTPGQNSPEQVGKKISELYALLYGHNDPAFLKAGVLRAQAAKLRDMEGKDTDWQKVEDLLRKSYQELGKVIFKKNRESGKGE